MKRLGQFLFKKHPKKTLIGFIFLLISYWFCLPNPLFEHPSCMVLEDREGNLLGAKIATDGQWRFPEIDSLPYKFEQALLEFEDRRFYSHWGVDPKGISRALYQNIKNRRIVSGGSTISMQVIRMARNARSRNIWTKLVEMVLASRLELKYSKKDILKLYASHAPFGGNVVGLETASWRYFGKKPSLLSWSESAMLAVLPNSPSLIHPSKNRQALFEKRNRLLQRLFEKGIFDKLTLELALEEPLPEKPLPLPRLSPHLLERAHQEYVLNGKIQNAKIKSTLQAPLQQQLNKSLTRFQSLMQHNEVYNSAALVIDIEKNEVIAYVGNVPDVGEAHSEAVDIIPAARSTGSILKPLLYAMMLQEGSIHPTSLVPDIPIQLSGYRPENFHQDYDGMVTAQRALIRSLNVPIIYLLQQYGLEKFHYQLKKLGFSNINQPASYYGLPLVLGGAEANLWDLTSTYAAMARTLKHAYKGDGEYAMEDFEHPTYLLKNKSSTQEPTLSKKPPFLSSDAIWFTLEAMRKLERPGSEGDWQAFSSSRPIAWKTGTSFGFRDAWAIGVTTKYAVGVWVGNADGEGRPGIIGVHAAAPILFDIFDQLPYSSEWFQPPYDAIQEIELCTASGYRPTIYCPKTKVWAPSSVEKLASCRFHRLFHLNADSSQQVHSKCYPPDQMQHKSYFILPPVEEHYYKSKNPDYQTVPPISKDCEAYASADSPMQLIYPKEPTQIYVPIDLNGELSKTVFKIAHRNAKSLIYWHIDNEYIGSTQDFHNLELQPDVGKHRLALVDEKGNRLELNFEIIQK